MIRALNSAGYKFEHKTDSITHHEIPQENFINGRADSDNSYAKKLNFSMERFWQICRVVTIRLPSGC